MHGDYSRSEATLARAREALARREAMDALRLAHRALAQAMDAFGEATGVNLLGPSSDSPAAQTYLRLGRVLDRMDSGLMRHLHVEEAEGYLRQVGDQTARLRETRMGAPAGRPMKKTRP